ncbi:hypothetical protein BDW69DRAFT_189788 [Aspergillus filifer]
MPRKRMVYIGGEQSPRRPTNDGLDIPKTPEGINRHRTPQKMIVSKESFSGGVFQGCAASVFTLLAEQKTLGGFIALSGWLPFEGEIAGIVNQDFSKTTEED